MDRIKTTIVRGLLVLGFGVAPIGSAAAQARGIELNGFFGIYGPTAKEGLEGTRAALRRGSPSLVGRVQQNRLFLDLRSVLPRQDIPLVEAFQSLTTGEVQPVEPAE